MINKKWLLRLSTTFILVLMLVIPSIKGISTNLTVVQEETRISPMLVNDQNSTVYDEQEGLFTSNSLNEVHTDKVYVTSHNVLPQYYIQTDINKNYVDSIVNSFNNFIKRELDRIIVSKTESELYTIEKKRIEAKAYLSVPISSFLWILLLLFANKIENKQLIIVALSLLIASVIGSFIVIPTIICYL